MAIALRPERHTLLIVIAGTVIGMPAACAACRAGICPAPAVSTWPMITYSTCSGATPDFSSAPLMARPPRSEPEKSLSDPSSRPIGVRAPATITDTGRSAVVMVAGLQRLRKRCAPTLIATTTASDQRMTKRTRHPAADLWFVTGAVRTLGP